MPSPFYILFRNWVAGSCLAAVALPQAAYGQVAAPAQPLDITWTAPEGCPTLEQVIEELTKAVDPGDKQLPPLMARAIVQQDGATWRLQLLTEIDGRRGVRLLEADSCEGLARASTLVMALALGEGLARREQAEVEASAAPPPVPPAPSAPPVPAPAPEPLRALIWLAGGLGTDAVGELGPALSLGAALQPSLLQVGVRLEVTLPRSSALVASGGTLDTSSFTADIATCLAPTLQPVQLAACVHGGFTLLAAKGEGTARDDSALIPLPGVGPSAGLRWLPSENAFLHLGIASRFFLARPQLVVEGISERRRVEAAGVGAELGGGVRW